MEGVTKELATEIKSEIRDIIAQVDDALLENNENEGINADKRLSIDVQRFNKRKAYSLPVTNSGMTPNTSLNTLISSSSQSSFCSSSSQCNNSSLPATISAERFSEYLVGFASEVVSEMKSEFRDVVSVVDGIMSPQVDCSKSQGENRNNSDVNSRFHTHTNASKPIDINVAMSKLCKEEKHLSDLQCSQDSGINLTERDLSPPDSIEINPRATKISFDDSIEHDIVHERATSKRKLSKTKLPTSSEPQWLYPSKAIWKPTLEVRLIFLNPFQFS